MDMEVSASNTQPAGIAGESRVMTLRNLCKQLRPDIKVVVEFVEKREYREYVDTTAGAVLELEPGQYADCDLISWQFAPSGFKSGNIVYSLYARINGAIIG